MTAKTVDGNVMDHVTLPVHLHVAEIQPYGHLVRLPIALSKTVCREGVEHLNESVLRERRAQQPGSD